MNVVYALSAYPVGALSDRIGRVALLAAGLLVLAVADVLLAFAESISTLTAAVALWGLHMGMTQGLLATLVADTAPGDLRGTAFGLLNLVTGLTLLAASAIAGGLWDWIGPGATFTAGAAFSLVAMLALIAVRRRIGSNDAGPHSPTP
jgi:MFS family permease